ncbi:hypothetical protein CDLVIII_0978 [Clostridium sp. DL-VIII]|uniref:DUF2178 domain-containing protein n=1 Tax=Clostridium sp. DL-VIII TaxID=641107 RepID=UPI00023AF2B3|nr:DUF2178 domain-containing protein [Clostridium sp. DL-VIII]EHI97684.1 hypothetical protein CDLVIII_0978 [Clostridium sp. DL-VIII]
MENKKKTDSIIIGAGVWAIFFIGIGIFDFVTQKNGYLIMFCIGILSLLYFIYLLKTTQDNLSERYEDERKILINEKSSSISYNILFAGICIFEFLINGKIIDITTDLSLVIIMASAIIIKAVTYLICKYKY